MTYLRQRMIEDMQFRGMAASTQGNYVRAVRQLSEYQSHNRTIRHVERYIRTITHAAFDFEIEHFLELLGYYIHEVYGIFHRQLPKLNKNF